MGLSGWHPGEVAVQTRLGYDRAMAMAQGYLWTNDHLPIQHRIFHTKNLAIVPVTTLDSQGRPWGSILSDGGKLGFISSPEDTTLIINFGIIDGDPIVENLASADEGRSLIAGLGIEFPTRRRNKFGGKITEVKRVNSSIELSLHVNQALGNCPKYISIRSLNPYPNANPQVIHKNLQFGRDQSLPQSVVDFIHAADTVFLGTSFVSSPENSIKFPSHLGMNHRGGRSGFIRVRNGRTCVIPDYSGNRMMQSLGNVETTGLASLTFFDFVTGDILYITGEAQNIVGDEAKAIMPRINVLTTVDVTGFVYVANALPVRQKNGSVVEASPYSPPVRFLAGEKRLESSLDDVSVTLKNIKLYAPDLATFTFDASKLISIKPGQHAILDLSSFVGKPSYQHMAHQGLEASLNDDSIRTWTVSSSHPIDTLTFEITMKEKHLGTITGKLFHLARTLSERRPELLADTTPLGITAGLVGVGGDFILPTRAHKLLLVAGGIGVTPFLSMLSAIASSTSDESWDVILVVSTREPQIFQKLLSKAVQSGSNIHVSVHIFVSKNHGLLQTSDVSGDVCTETHAQDVLHEGRLNTDFFSTIEDIRERKAFVCGPLPFEAMVVNGLQDVGVDGIERENFAY